MYSTLEGFGSLDLDTLQSPGKPVNEEQWHQAFSKVPDTINTAWIPAGRSGFGSGVLLNELWLLYPVTINSPYADVANGKKSIYASAYQCRNQAGIDKFKKVIKDRNMNSVVIDMKDDYGLLRYNSKNPLVLVFAVGGIGPSFDTPSPITNLNLPPADYKGERIVLAFKIDEKSGSKVYYPQYKRRK